MSKRAGGAGRSWAPRAPARGACPAPAGASPRLPLWHAAHTPTVRLPTPVDWTQGMEEGLRRRRFPPLDQPFFFPLALDCLFAWALEILAALSLDIPLSRRASYVSGFLMLGPSLPFGICDHLPGNH